MVSHKWHRKILQILTTGEYSFVGIILSQFRYAFRYIHRNKIFATFERPAIDCSHRIRNDDLFPEKENIPTTGLPLKEEGISIFSSSPV